MTTFTLGDALRKAIESNAPESSTADTIEHTRWPERSAALLEFYEQNQETIDQAVETLLTHGQGARAKTYTQQLEGVLRRERSLDEDLARSFFDDETMQPLRDVAQTQGVVALSGGIALPQFDVIIGGTAGIDVIVALDTAQVFGRFYAQAAAGLDASIGVGLSFGIWQDVPTVDRTTYTGGFYLDIWIPGYWAFVRITAVEEGPKFWSSGDDLSFLGVLLTANFGIGAGVAWYRGVEFLVGLPSLRSQLTVTNCTDGTDPCEPGTASIGQNVASTMVCALENTSGKTITVASGDDMNLYLPRYFDADDLDAIEVTTPSDDWTSQGWSSATRKLTLEYSGSDELEWTGTLTTTLSNAVASHSSPTRGYFKVTIPKAVVDDATIQKPGTASTAKVTLVPSIQYATINTWSSTTPSFTPTSDSGSDVSATTQSSSSTVVELAEVTDADDNIWELGYQFYVDDTTNDPYFRACFYKQGTFPIFGKTLYAPNWKVVTTDGITSTAYFGNVDGGSDCLEITVTLDDSGAS